MSCSRSFLSRDLLVWVLVAFTAFHETIAQDTIISELKCEPRTHLFTCHGIRSLYNNSQVTLDAFKDGVRLVLGLPDTSSVQVHEYVVNSHLSWFNRTIDCSPSRLLDPKSCPEPEIMSIYKTMWDESSDYPTRVTKLYIGGEVNIGIIRLTWLGPCVQGARKRTLSDSAPPVSSPEPMIDENSFTEPSTETTFADMSFSDFTIAPMESDSELTITTTDTMTETPSSATNSTSDATTSPILETNPTIQAQPSMTSETFSTFPSLTINQLGSSVGPMVVESSFTEPSTGTTFANMTFSDFSIASMGSDSELTVTTADTVTDTASSVTSSTSKATSITTLDSDDEDLARAQLSTSRTTMIAVGDSAPPVSSPEPMIDENSFTERSKETAFANITFSDLNIAPIESDSESTVTITDTVTETTSSATSSTPEATTSTTLDSDEEDLPVAQPSTSKTTMIAVGCILGATIVLGSVLLTRVITHKRRGAYKLAKGHKIKV